jgi:thiamine biosynthesis lipoprotein
VKVPKEFFDLVERSLKISKLTQGAFDISYGGLDKKFWNFDLSMKALPTVSEREEMIKLVNYQNIILDKTEQTVFLKQKGMRIGFGGIGKGYAAEMAKWLLQKNGVLNGFVNASGDISAWGKQDLNKPWTIGIADPNHKNQLFSSLQINNQAIATSGNYEKYVVIDGKKYSHTIDPKTGFPVSGIKSVTIITANAELADALATPIMVMGINAGLDLINQMNGVECIIIDDDLCITFFI